MAPFHLLGLDHVVLRVADLDRARAFYCGVLGCAFEKWQEAFGLLQLRAGRSLIDLIAVDGPLGRKGGPAPGPLGHNADHFCLRIEPFDAAALAAHFAAHGIAAARWSNAMAPRATVPRFMSPIPTATRWN